MTTSLQNLSHLPNILAIDSGLDLRTRGMCGPTPPFTGGFIPAFARCCFCIAANLLVFTSPTVFPPSAAYYTKTAAETAAEAWSWRHITIDGVVSY